MQLSSEKAQDIAFELAKALGKKLSEDEQTPENTFHCISALWLFFTVGPLETFTTEEIKAEHVKYSKKACAILADILHREVT